VAVLSDRFRDWSVSRKLVTFSVATIAAILAVFIVVVTQISVSALEKRADERVRAEAHGVTDMMDMFNRSQLATVEKFSRLFRQLLPGTFTVDAQRQIETGGIAVPALQHDATDLNLNFSAVDKFTQMTSGNATVFVKNGDDFIRITTSVKKTDGSRAVGTSLGRSHPAYDRVMQGQAYRGVAVLFGKPHVTEYAPVKDAANNVIGILYVGIDISVEVAALKERIKALKVGESGYFFVLNSKQGDEFGNFIVHPSKEGQRGLDLRDTEGREVVKDMLQAKEGALRYTPAAENASERREQLVVFQTNEDWNWMIGGIAFADEIAHEVNNLRMVSLIVGVAALFGFSALLLLIVRNVVSKPLERAREAASRLAQGDLTVQIAVGSRDEIGQLMVAINGISQGLAGVVATIREGTEQVATASTEIAVGNHDLSVRTETQAGSLEETASTMEELTATVKQNADNARQANQLAVTASSAVTKGGEVVAQVVSTMEAIDASSKKIVDIISVIDGIAFQTNILALNAAVEAARAGEQGRGFAVVATEVRSLAQRSAGAAKEIKALIGESVDKVESGSRLVVEAGQAMDHVVDSIRRVTDIISEITAATQEQSSGIEQVNHAISEMDQVTQQNAALVEQASAAAGSLEDMAATLAQSVSVFKLDRIRQAPAATAATSRAEPALAVRSGKPVPKAMAQPAMPSPNKTVRQQAAAQDEWEEF
jgi:methyl-accepting chemotaxis protein-2 (aspartate sensor receptor)